MRHLKLHLHRAWRLGVVFVLILSTLISSGPARAQEGPEVPRLSIGPWSGVAHAAGIATAQPSGLDFLWDGSVRADLDIDVHDETSVTGEWTHQGSADFTITGTVEGRQARIDADLAFSGPGTVSGTPEELMLNGTTHNTGTVTASTSQGSFTTSVDSQSEIPTLQVKVTHAICDEAYGDWVWAIEQEFEEEGFSADLSGAFMVVRGGSEIQDQLRQLSESILGEEAPEETRSPLFEMITEYLKFANDLVDAWPNWNMDLVMDTLSWGEKFLNQLRNLRPCDKRFFGEDLVEHFANGLTFHIQQLIIGGAGLEEVSGDDVFKMMEVATRVGAFGPGAANPAEAVRSEEALRQAAQDILEANLDPSDNRIFINDDTQKVMLTGAIMGWTFVVGGEEYDARATYAESGLSESEDNGQTEGEQ